jgi:glyoxylase-like metal-dependent hydrolase (beta-lactamase superfamily II)
MDRRTWLARAGIALAGASGAVLALGAARRYGIVTPAGANAQPVDVKAHRVNLGFVSAYVVVRGSKGCIVDTGVANSIDAISAVVEASGIGWSDILDVTLTHHHPDHAGSAADVMARATNSTLWVGEADMPRINVPYPMQAAADGAEICGLQVVATPGHTLGHISLVDPDLGTLITGDAIVNVGGNLAASPPMFTENMDLANASVRRLADLGMENVLFMHGEPIEGGAAAALRRLADGM